MTASPLSPEIIYINTTNIKHFDALDASAMSRAEVEAQRQVSFSLEILQRYVPGFKDAFLVGPMPKTCIRASCRILGEYQVTKEDISSGRRFPDSIARGCYPISVQSLEQPNVRHHLYVENGGDYDVPYRSLIPQKVDGLLMAGRCISATREASGATRTGAQCMAYGHATGTAAAISAQARSAPQIWTYQRYDGSCNRKAQSCECCVVLELPSACGVLFGETVRRNAASGQQDRGQRCQSVFRYE